MKGSHFCELEELAIKGWKLACNDCKPEGPIYQKILDSQQMLLTRDT